MTTIKTNGETPRKLLRVWPGVLVAVIVVLLRFVVPLVVPGTTIYGIMAGLIGGVAILLWWMFFSRAPWLERVGAVLLMVIATLATYFLVHPSIAGGMMGRMVFVIAVPITLGPAFVAWAVATRRLPDRVRRVTMVAVILAACGMWTLLRTDGITGEGDPQLAWRWTPTPEQRLLAQGQDAPNPVAPAARVTEPSKEPAGKGDKPAAEPPATAAEPPAAAKSEPAAPASKDTAKPVTGDPGIARVEWPGFRGPARDSVIKNARIETDWSKSPPVELWRRPIGPGWSSFAVRGDVLYTQEQRGDDEVVAAYRVSTGEPVWRHTDEARFYESNGGPGPRGTPALSGDRLYTFGATGILNALDAASGKVIWSRNASSDTGVKIPGWGFTSSPLVVDDLVIVAVSGAVAAYDRATGDRRWFKESRGGSYSSPQLVTLNGVRQILLLGGFGVTSIAPSDGQVLWENEWKGIPIVQPAVIGPSDVLITSADAMGGFGLRRLSVTQGPSGWTVDERWTSRGLKPYFNDFVVHEGHAFGFDGSILACVDLENGERKWKGGRYGQGQLVVLPDQDVLLVLSEEGEIALVSATTDKFTELARFKAIEGKTWNHPVLIGDLLLVRNGEEMAAFKLPRAATHRTSYE